MGDNPEKDIPFPAMFVILFIALLLFGAPAVAKEGAREKQAVRISFPDMESLEQFLADKESYEKMVSEGFGSLTDFLMTMEQVERLQESGREFTILPREDLAYALNLLTSNGSRGLQYTNYTFATLEADLNSLAAAHPTEADLSIIGHGHDGNPVYLMKVSDNVSMKEDETRLLFHGVHHAGEAIGADCCMGLLHYLLDNYGTDPQATAYVDDFEIYAVPLSNPDGWMKIETGAVYSWRKNTRDNNNNGLFDPGYDGVDLNRNMSFNWGMAGSGSPSSSVYYGPYPLSEPENQALAALVEAEHFAFGVSYHMSGDIVILPWTWNGKKTPDHATYHHIGSLLGSQMGYSTMTWFETGGFFQDHLYGWHGTFCYSIEVTSGTSPSSIQQQVAKNLAGARFLLDRAYGGQITGIVSNAKTGQPHSAKVEILEIDTSELPDRTSDPIFGRYRWILNDGIYSLRVSSTQGYSTADYTGLRVIGAALVQDVSLQPLENWIDGYPEIGNPVSLNLDGSPGEGFYQFVGLATANISLPPYSGTLQVDPSGLVVIASGILGPSGSTACPLQIPANPSLVGLEVYYQSLAGLSGGAGHFTNLAWMSLL